ncbi:hypothetical protein ACVWXM_006705 [Bradyrhizobium sp. GM7.3]|jgi:hypothetical protein
MVQISQPGKPYLETARTLVRAAQTITDSAIAGQLKALADDYERRAEKASHVDRPKHSPHWLLALNAKLEAFNLERVRGYIECSIGCKKKEVVIHALRLHPRTVAKAIKIVRANADRRDRALQS